MCELHNELEATYYCVEDKELLCKECKDMHTDLNECTKIIEIDK